MSVAAAELLDGLVLDDAGVEVLLPHAASTIAAAATAAVAPNLDLTFTKNVLLLMEAVRRITGALEDWG